MNVLKNLVAKGAFFYNYVRVNVLQCFNFVTSFALFVFRLARGAHTKCHVPITSTFGGAVAKSIFALHLAYWICVDTCLLFIGSRGHVVSFDLSLLEKTLGDDFAVFPWFAVKLQEPVA